MNGQYSCKCPKEEIVGVLFLSDGLLGCSLMRVGREGWPLWSKATDGKLKPGVIDAGGLV